MYQCTFNLFTIKTDASNRSTLFFQSRSQEWTLGILEAIFSLFFLCADPPQLKIVTLLTAVADTGRFTADSPAFPSLPPSGRVVLSARAPACRPAGRPETGRVAAGRARGLYRRRMMVGRPVVNSWTAKPSKNPVTFLARLTTICQLIQNQKMIWIRAWDLACALDWVLPCLLPASWRFSIFMHSKVGLLWIWIRINEGLGRKSLIDKICLTCFKGATKLCL